MEENIFLHHFLNDDISSFQTGVTNLYNEFVNKGVTPSGQTLSAMKAAVVSLYNAGTAAGASSGHHTTTYTMTTAEKTKDLGVSHNYRYIDANNVYNAGSNSAHQTTTYTAGTKASAAASTYDMGASNKYRYINATAAWNKATNVGYANGTNASVSYFTGTAQLRNWYDEGIIRFNASNYNSCTVVLPNQTSGVAVTLSLAGTTYKINYGSSKALSGCKNKYIEIRSNYDTNNHDMEHNRSVKWYLST